MPTRLRIAAFGDSLMWGQGLRRSERFSELFAAAMQRETGKPGDFFWDRSRSGAKIRDQDPDRDNFIDTYPSLFNTAAVRSFNSGDERAATALYGEEPATFPTIRGQVAMLPPADGRKVDVALVDGGANDINIEDVFNPLVADNQYVERFDGQIRSVALDSVQFLLSDVRRKCPNAVILYFGLFLTISYDTSAKALYGLLKHEYDDDFKWWFNKYIYQEIDVNRLIREAQIRSIWFQGRWQYWSRQAVAAIAADDTLRGPGVIFVPSTFTEENAGYASNSFIFDDYTDPTWDPARPDRLKNLHRLEYYKEMLQLAALIKDENVGPLHDIAKESAEILVSGIDGPLTLVRNLQDYIAGRVGADGFLLESLGNEIHRIQNALIASFGHPRPEGAAAYANSAIRRYVEYKDRIIQVAEESRPGYVAIAGASTLDAQLRSYGLRSQGTLAADVGHFDVDSIAVLVKTAANSSRNLGEAVWLYVKTRDSNGAADIQRYMLTFLWYVDPIVLATEDGDPIGKIYPHFEPNSTNRFTVDTMGRLRLDEIVGCALVMGPDPYANSEQRKRYYGVDWCPETVALEVNGVQVRELSFFDLHLGPGDQLDLHYPGTLPQETPPERADPRIGE